MIKRYDKGVLIICGCLVVCLLGNFFSTTLLGSEKRYEVRPEITLPESRTEIDRLIDAYERMMANYMRLLESDLLEIQSDIADISKKTDSLEQRIAGISDKIDAIQKELGIETVENPDSASVAPDKTNLEITN